MPTVLVADDDPDLRSTVKLLLEDEGYTVLESGTGQQTLDLLHTHPEKLIVLLDLSLRVGAERISDIVANNPALVNRHTCILFTAASSSEIERFGRGWPVIQKPFQIDSLLSTIEQVCTE